MNDLRSGTCPSCGHNEVIEATPQEEGREGDEEPLALARGPKGRALMMRVEGEKVGQLTTYTCRQCGLTQWVADRPDQVPIGEEYGTRLIAGPAPQPFR